MSNWTIKSVLDWAAADFKSKNMESPRLEAEVLLAHVLGLARLELYTKFDRPLDENERTQFRQAIAKRRSGYPVSYITGTREFWSLDFDVNEHVLVPRPETELLVETALKTATKQCRILDLCTGSGCIAIALATELPDANIDAIDISTTACEIAKINAEKHKVNDRVQILKGNLFEPLPSNSKYDIIVSNPPYVLTDEIPTLSPEVQKEPASALDGGKDGLDLVRQILEAAPSHLEPSGSLMLEVDPRQTELLATDIGEAALGVTGTIIKDLAGLKRVVSWLVD